MHPAWVYLRLPRLVCRLARRVLEP